MLSVKECYKKSTLAFKNPFIGYLPELKHYWQKTIPLVSNIQLQIYVLTG